MWPALADFLARVRCAIGCSDSQHWSQQAHARKSPAAGCQRRAGAKWPARLLRVATRIGWLNALVSESLDLVVSALRAGRASGGLATWRISSIGEQSQVRRGAGWRQAGAERRQLGELSIRGPLSSTNRASPVGKSAFWVRIGRKLGSDPVGLQYSGFILLGGQRPRGEVGSLLIFASRPHVRRQRRPITP
jgi:hypothetical protein